METQSPTFPDPGNEFEPKEISSVVKDCLQQYKGYARPYLARAEYNELLAAGEQWNDISDVWEIEDTDWPEYATKSMRNLIANLELTWAAKLTEDRPFVKCFPARANADIRKAEIGNHLLSYMRSDIDWDSLTFDAAIHVQNHTAVGFKTVWDPLSGEPSPGVPVIDEVTGMPVLDELGRMQYEGVGDPVGAVRIDVVSIFDYGTDGNQDIEKADWCFFQKHIDKYEAMGLLEAAGQNKNLAKVDKYQDIWGDDKEGVLVTELWWRPNTFRFPDGLYAVMVGDAVISAQTYPYNHGELPLAVWKCGPRRGSPFGTSHVNNAAPIQRTVNKIVSALDRQAELIASIKLLSSQQILDEWSYDHGQIPVTNPEMAAATRYVEPPNRIQVLSEGLIDNVQALYAVFGMSELLSGAESMKSGTAAQSIAFLNKLDGMKMAGASRSLAKATVRVWRQALYLCTQFMEVQRFMEISDGTIQDVIMFTGADLEGLSVKMEPNSGFDFYSASGQDDADADMQVEGPTPAIKERQQTGLQQDSGSEVDSALAKQQIQACIAGQPVQADPNIDPNIALKEIVTVFSHYQGAQQQGALQQLMLGYKQMRNAAMMQQQQPQPGAPQ